MTIHEPVSRLPVPARHDARSRTRQAAALCWRESEFGLQVLLVTSTTTGRWVLPKGWVETGENQASAAAREAFEEAGVEGDSSCHALGQYRYLKRRKNGASREVVVEIFAMQVIAIHADWPEKQRRRLWASPEAAARMVAEPDLALLIRRFARDAA